MDLNHCDIDYICKTTDGKYILGGTTYTGIRPDFWVIKTDANGNFLWSKRYGGTDADALTCLVSTNDGGYVLGGETHSDSSGDVSQISRGGRDFWIIKLDSLGNKQWDKRFGGSGDDYMFCMKVIKDGGYILGGYSKSGISGDKTQDNRDTTLSTPDYWIVKIDSAGNKQWDKRFGTIGDENEDDVIPTPDGGYLIGGTSSNMDTSFDKTQINYAGKSNFWVVKTDSAGNKLWDKVYEGTYRKNFGNLLMTRDGNYMLGAGNASSLACRNCDVAIGDSIRESNNEDDYVVKCGYWLVKINKSGANLGEWTYATDINCSQASAYMSNTSDGGYLLSGESEPVIEEYNTGINNSLGQAWTIKIDSQMNRVWDKTVFTTITTMGSAFESSSHPGCYTLGVMDQDPGMRTEPKPGQITIINKYDYWMAEYCDTVLTGRQEPEGAMHLQVYPNSTSNDLYIHTQKDGIKEASYTLTNTKGKAIYQNTADHLAHSYTKILDIHSLPKGVYKLEVTVDGERIVKKVIKK